MNRFNFYFIVQIFCFFLCSVSYSELSQVPQDNINDITSSVQIWNRAKGQEETEKVFAGNLLQWAYNKPSGRFLDQIFFSKKLFSQLCGVYQSSPLSKLHIAPFISQFQIQTDEFEPGPFSSFNAFFSRQFKPGARTFVSNSNLMPAFVEGRYFAYDSSLAQQDYPVKGKTISLSALLGNEEKAKPFLGGPVIIARLSPMDYHRFHFPDDGNVLEYYTIPGKLKSVNPIALKQNPEILLENERQVSILNTLHFGKLAFIEVGALCVGKIIQTHPIQEKFHRGDEKGYFLFGGSTVIVLGEPKRWIPDTDIALKTRENRESLIRLGERIGSTLPVE